MRRLHDEKSWEIIPGVNVSLPCKTKRQPDISGWKQPSRLDITASQVTQRPDWVCEILWADTREQDLPGQITVYKLAVDEFVQVQQVSMIDNTKRVVLQPFAIKFDVEELFAYLC